MNTNVYIRLYSQIAADDILLDVQYLFASFEKRLSRFYPASELSKLNNEQQESIPVSPTLQNAIEVALWAAETTGGLYDPTILTNLEKAGYDRSFEKITQTVPLSASAPRPCAPTPLHPFSFRSVHLNRAIGVIHKPVDLRLDLGGMGKGWTVDRAADRLQGLGPFLINAGGDIFAYHSPLGQAGWEVDLIHPQKPDLFMAKLRLHHQALATSTIAKRRWQHNGQMMHHLIDPRTGLPAQTDALSVTVVTDRTVTAEIYAKVALILGAEQGLAYLESLPGVEGLIYTAESAIIHTPGLANILDEVAPEGYSFKQKDDDNE
jgi:thiamine biosynthesis lipoprotein